MWFCVILQLDSSTMYRMYKLKCTPLVRLIRVGFILQNDQNNPLTFLPLLCCRMSQTGLRLNWAEEFQHLACIYSLRSFGCSWWFPVDPQRLNCSEFGPCLPWTRRAWCSGAWLPQLGLSVKSLCDTQDWVIPSVRIGREIEVVTTWLEGLRWNVRT